MIVSLTALIISAILFTIFVSLALLPFFPTFAAKLGAMPKKVPPIDFLKDPRGHAKSFRLEAKKKIVKGNYSPKHPLKKPERLYVQGNAFIASKSKLFSLACDQSGVIGHEVKILDWIDAQDQLEIGDRCSLGSYATCQGKLQIGKGSTFKNLHAAPIHTSGKSPEIICASQQQTTADTSWFIGHHWVMIPQNSQVKESLVSEKSVWVKQGANIQGSLRSLQDIRLDEGVHIEGSLFAEGDIEIGPNCTIRGHIFAQGEVHLGQGTKIGTKEAHCSVEGIHTIKMGPNVQIYGFASTHGVGMISL